MVVFQSNSKISSTPAADVAKTEVVDPYAALRAEIPVLRNMTKENFTDYTSLFAAYTRAVDTKREDRIVNDPYAEDLAGMVAKAFLAYFPSYFEKPEVTMYAALRHRLIDDEIQEHLNPAIQQVVFVGAGMDSRSYRLSSLADCHVFELDGCRELVEHKKSVVEEKQIQLLAKEHDMLITNLAEDSWSNELIAHGYDPSKPSLWVAEGFVQYLDEDAVDRLFQTIDRLSAPESVALIEMGGNGKWNMEFEVQDDQIVWNADTMTKTHQGGVLRAFPWDREMLFQRDSEANYSGSRWDPIKFARAHIPKDEATVGPWFIAKCTKPTH